MIKDTIAENERINVNDKDIAALKQHFPGCFKKDGSFDVEKLAIRLKDKVDITREGYELNFLGKSYSKLLAALDTTTVIKPNMEHNEKAENQNSENIYISGDNLDALKHLLKSYAGKIKCIYIDPPYNTGSDGFVYNDKFDFSAKDLETRLSIDENQAQKIIDMTARKSSSHSAWLTFMYPRLLLARDLLTDDGVIFISIDDNEQANLKLLCDDVFGEDNFVGAFVWKRRSFSALAERNISSDHEYVVAYQKIGFIAEGISKEYRGYSNPDNDSRGDWTLGDLTVGMNKDQRPNQFYDLVDPVSGKVYPANPNRVWSYIPESVDKLIREKRVVFPEDISKRPMMKRFKSELKSDVNPISTWMDVGLNSQATREIQKLLGGNIFSYTKPISLLSSLLCASVVKDDIILDFFSGSATTAHTVMQLNAEDNGNRKYIMVQLPEECKKESEAYKAGYRTIDQIGIERIIRAAKKIKEETGADIDYGFKCYDLCEPNQNTLDKLEIFNPLGIVADITILDDFGRSAVLSTWMVKDGYGFTAGIEEVNLGGYSAYLCAKHLYLIHDNITAGAIAALIEKYENEGSFNPDNIVLFGYSFGNWSYLEMLKNNIKLLNSSEKNLKVNVVTRY